MTTGNFSRSIISENRFLPLSWNCKMYRFLDFWKYTKRLGTGARFDSISIYERGRIRPGKDEKVIGNVKQNRVYQPGTNAYGVSFDALEWWKAFTPKFRTMFPHVRFLRGTSSQSEFSSKTLFMLVIVLDPQMPVKICRFPALKVYFKVYVRRISWKGVREEDF